MTIEITTGFLMFWGGLAGAVLSFIGALIYFAASSAKAKKLLRKIDEEEL